MRSASGPLTAIAIALSLLAGGCEEADSPSLPVEYTVAEELGFDSQRLFWALDAARATGTVQSVVVERHGTVVAEGHFLDVPPWGVSEMWSVTAALTSVLAGVAVDRGYLESLDEPLGDLLIPWADHLDPEKSSITIRQLLTMTSGVRRPRGTPEEYFEWLAQANHVAWVLDLPLTAPPGEHYAFDSGAAHLLAAALEEAAGMTLEALAQEAVFEPLGVPYYQWLSDPQGVNYGGFGLQLRSRDMVKLGRLILDGGEWNGTRVVSSGWVGQATEAKIHPYPESPEWGFGYLWKITELQGYPCYYVNGYGGQILAAFPSLDLVIAVTSAYTEDADLAYQSHDAAWSIILDRILPSVH